MRLLSPILALTTALVAGLAAPVAAQLPSRSKPVEVVARTRADRERNYVKIVRVPGPPAPTAVDSSSGHRTWWFFANGGFDARRDVYTRWRRRHNSSVLFTPSVVVQPPLIVAPRYFR